MFYLLIVLQDQYLSSKSDPPVNFYYIFLSNLPIAGFGVQRGIGELGTIGIWWTRGAGGLGRVYGLIGLGLDISGILGSRVTAHMTQFHIYDGRLMNRSNFLKMFKGQHSLKDPHKPKSF